MKLYAGSMAAVAWLTLSGTLLAQEASPALDERPSTGIGALGSGVAFTTMGALSFATAPICKTSVVNAPQQSTCFTTSFLVGTPLLALGIPLVVFGAVQHAKYDEWARRHPTLSGLGFSPAWGGGAVAWSGRF